MKSVRALVASLALLFVVPSFAQQFESVDDLALIWIGGRHRSVWNKDLFTPYLVHEFADGRRSWLFDGFLMIEGATTGERRPGEPLDQYKNRMYSFGEAPLTPANKEMWEWLMERQMGINDGLGCRALDERIGELIPELGEPTYKHQVVMTLPIPIGADMTWGVLNGTPLNFSKFEDRVAAMKWYVDLLIEKWKAADFKHIELAGIYWLRESITDSFYEPQCATAMSDYAHEKNLKMYWIPYYRAPHFADWKSYHMDQVYHQPNYVFTTDTPIERLWYAVDDCYEYGLGMEMEFEGCCIDGFEDGINDTRHVIPQGNSCLYDHSPAFYQRFVDYVEEFEQSGIFDHKPIAYYAGYQAVYDFAMSNNPKDREIIDRLAANIVDRHISSKWYVPSYAGLSETVADQKATVYGLDGAIYVSCDFDMADIAVYTLDGRMLHLTPVESDMRYGTTLSCDPGVYVVRVADKSYKVAVR